MLDVMEVMVIRRVIVLVIMLVYSLHEKGNSEEASSTHLDLEYPILNKMTVVSFPKLQNYSFRSGLDSPIVLSDCSGGSSGINSFSISVPCDLNVPAC